MQHIEKWKRQMMGFVKLVILLSMGCFGMLVQADMVYVANVKSHNVSVIDTTTNKVVATIPVGSYPQGLAINPAGTRVYVTNTESDDISVIDTSSNSVVATISVGSDNFPTNIAVSPNGTRVYVTNNKSGNVSVIDANTNSLVTTLKIGRSVRGVAVSPDGLRVYVATNEVTGTFINVIDTTGNNIVTTIRMGTGGLSGVGINPSGTFVYVAHYYVDNNIDIIDTSNNKVVATVSVGSIPMGIAINPSGTRVYVTNYYTSNTVSVIDTSNNTVIATVPMAINPDGISVNSSGTRVYVANHDSDNIGVIDTSTNNVVATIPVGSGPSGLVIRPTNTSTPTAGNLITPEMWARAVIHTEERGNIEAVWKQGGDETTKRGDRVIWGYFYANPKDVSWGSENNPDIFAKIWFDASGRVDVNFFHVSVPDIEVFSCMATVENCTPVVHTTTMEKRYARHSYQPKDGVRVVAELLKTPALDSSGKVQENPKHYSLPFQNVELGSIFKLDDGRKIEGVWREGGFSTTASGDQVAWGYFYANPNDVDWGSEQNPDVYVKFWYDKAANRIDVNFFHVSAPSINVYSGRFSEYGGVTPINTVLRYTRHVYKP